MDRDSIEWNFDRIHSAQSLIFDTQNDMMRCLHKGEVLDVVRDRMAQRLRAAADNIDKLTLCHEIETAQEESS
jgi:hypothetical protein